MHRSANFVLGRGTFAPTVKVIVVTATDDRDMHRQALLLGAGALFTKPFDIDDLVSVLSGSAGETRERREVDRPPPPVPATKERPAHMVLIVDDDPDMCKLLREFLDHKGYPIEIARDGQEAIRLVRDKRPQVVLLDILMPRLGGIEALTSILGIAPETRVIMISAISDLDVAKRSLAYGAFDYLQKPIDLLRLDEVLAAAFVRPWQ